MSYEAMELAIKYAGPYIKGENVELGTMLESRWYNLQQQLNILEVIPEQIRTTSSCLGKAVFIIVG